MQWSGRFINDTVKGICFHEKLFAEEVIYFLVIFLTIYVFWLAFLALK